MALRINIQSAEIPAGVDALSSEALLSYGKLQWEFALESVSDTPVSGAKITVDSNGPDLSKPPGFAWHADLRGSPVPDQQPVPPLPVPCTAGTSEATCGPIGTPLSNGGALHVFSSNPGGGVSSPFRPAFDSSRQAGERKLWSVTIKDHRQFWEGNGHVLVGLLDGFRPTGAQVTSEGRAVPACSIGVPNVPRCAKMLFQPGGVGSCGGTWSMAVEWAEPESTFIFSAQQADCATGKPAVVIVAAPFRGPQSCCDDGDSLARFDLNLGTITYAVSPSSAPYRFWGVVENQVRIFYPFTPAAAATPSPTPSPTPTARATTRTPTPLTTKLATTGGGASTRPHPTTFTYLIGWVFFSIAGLLVVRLAKARLRRQ